jgi:hypothetical protein
MFTSFSKGAAAMSTKTIFIITLVLIALIASAFYQTVNVFAAGVRAEGDSRYPGIIHTWHVDHKDGKVILMQDLTQCTLTFDGQIVCVDVCGGLSVPGTVCSFE